MLENELDTVDTHLFEDRVQFVQTLVRDVHLSLLSGLTFAEALLDFKEALSNARFNRAVDGLMLDFDLEWLVHLLAPTLGDFPHQGAPVRVRERRTRQRLAFERTVALLLGLDLILRREERRVAGSGSELRHVVSLVQELRVLQSSLGRQAVEHRLHFLLSNTASSSREARSVADVSVVHDYRLSFQSLPCLLPFLTLGASSAHTSVLLRHGLPLLGTDAWVFAFALQLELMSLVSFVDDALQLVVAPSHVSNVLKPGCRRPKALLGLPSLLQDLFDFERWLPVLSPLFP